MTTKITNIVINDKNQSIDFNYVDQWQIYYDKLTLRSQVYNTQLMYKKSWKKNNFMKTKGEKKTEVEISDNMQNTDLYHGTTLEISETNEAHDNGLKSAQQPLNT